MTTTKIPSLRPTILMTQRLIESASRDAAISYARLGQDIQKGLLSIEEEIEKYAVVELLEELGAITATTVQEKEVWSVEEAAVYYGVGKRTLHNMISRFKAEDNIPAWLLLPTEDIRKHRIHVKKFKEWYSHSPKKKGRPKIQN